MLSVREVALEAVQVDENEAMWTIVCRSTVEHCHHFFLFLKPSHVNMPSKKSTYTSFYWMF